MSAFEQAFNTAILREGGYKLHTVAGDRGGMTYAGIARLKNPDWPGWSIIDRGDIPPTPMVRDWYREGYWDVIRGDELHPDIAADIYDFATNTSAWKKPALAVKLAQIVCGTVPDGHMGPKTVAALNAMDPKLFKSQYFIAKIARYAAICNKDRSQNKFLLGWVNRSLQAVS